MVAARYINRELILTFAVAALVLLVVAAGGRFAGYLQEAAAGKYPADGLAALMGMRLPSFLQLLLPFAFHIAVLLTFGRLHADREMTVLHGSGAGPGRLFAWILPSLLALAGCVAWLSLSVAPSSNAAFADFMAGQRARAGFDGVQPGAFHLFDRGRRALYMEAIGEDRRSLRGLFLSERQPNGSAVVIWAERGAWHVDAQTGSRFLVLENGRRYAGLSGSSDYQRIEFKTLGQRLEAGPISGRRGEEDALTTEALRQRGDGAAAAELHWRLALPIFCLISALMGIGASRARPEQGRFAGVVPGVLLFLLYYAALLANRNALETGALPPILGLWPAHLAFLGAGAALFARAGRPLAI